MKGLRSINRQRDGMTNVIDGHEQTVQPAPRSLTARAASLLGGGAKVLERAVPGPMAWI